MTGGAFDRMEIVMKVYLNDTLTEHDNTSIRLTDGV